MADVRGPAAWMRLLAQVKLPAIQSVVLEVCQLNDRAESSADDLAQIILRDASLTSKVLRVANTVHYNRSSKPIQTVSRAIVQIGFVEVKNITLASVLIDSFLTGKPKTLLLQRLARSFHAAVQARAMVPKLDSERREQVFIAALLRHVAELALLASGEPAAEQFIVERDLYPDDEHAIAMKYLGVGIDTLNKELVKEWKLGDMLQEVVNPGPKANAISTVINLADSISQNIMQGLTSPQMTRNCQQLAMMCQLKLEESQQQILLMADEAAVVASSYGADKILPQLPDRQKVLEVTAQYSVTDFELVRHLNMLFKLFTLQDNLSKILHSVVLCLHEGAQLPRVSLMLMDYKSKSFEPRYVAGRDTLLWRQQLKIELDKLQKSELLHDLLLHQQPIWRQQNTLSQPLGRLEVLLPNDGDCLVASLKVEKRIFALLYADAAGRAISARQFAEFQLVAQTLQLMLQYHDNNQNPQA
ncbi:HDOD domain-containing protein [Rheinheimera sp.]|uniref:HDOD domain-containing protein n=1 Tax=Rheinheimera sp. TaxID=1869214 RepID=UPI0027BA5B54|nr:HDOD domain-containing protein [Rheinheimera sp.]